MTVQIGVDGSQVAVIQGGWSDPLGELGEERSIDLYTRIPLCLSYDEFDYR